ncbi:MAG: relaxase/mobilization nuclease domain-containing protein [Steroidobacteraceae bacterium]
MPKRLIDIPGVPLLDIASYARRGPGHRDRLSPAEIQQIARTVRRTPEVMVKVLSRGGQDLGAVRRHLDYLRLRDDGELELETDDGQRLSGEDVSKDLLKDWDLDLEEHRRQSDLDARRSRSPKLVHKLMFSMPAGTPSDKVLTAVKNFAREEFALKHRYAIVLHTDEPHPHVHMVVKAVSEQGIRLHIRKATLREWRREFAQRLREQGVAANATERAVRGETRKAKRDGIYRASRRNDSTHMRQQTGSVARDLANGGLRLESGKSKLVETRKEVRRAWQTVSDILLHEGQPDLSTKVRRFVDQMPPPLTEREWFAAKLVEQTREPPVREYRVC